MFAALYRIFIGGYDLVILLLCFFNKKAQKFRKGRKNWKEKLSVDLDGISQPVIWIHAASLGEFEQGRPIIEGIRKNREEIKILLTFFSPSGYEVKKNYSIVDWVYYLPMDYPPNAKLFIKIVNPKLAIFIKYEFWYFYLKELVNHHIPTLVVSAIFRQSQWFFGRGGRFFQSVFRQMEHFFVQDEPSRQLISAITNQATVSGDTRFDRVVSVADTANSYAIIEEFLNGEKCFVIGSSWLSDMWVLFPFMKKYADEFKFVVAPHNIHEEALITIESKVPHSCRYSMPKNLRRARLLIIDNIGMLSALYKYADLAFIGGGFRGALHNILEAAVYGVPLFFGDHKKNHKFREVVDLIEAGVAYPIRDSEALIKQVDMLNENKHVYNEICVAAKDYVYRKRGATKIIMRKILTLV